MLHGDQAVLLEVTPDEVPRRDRHSFQYARGDHDFVSVK
jgi:hypothetical protein